jgi:hypothetical protein
VDERLVVRVRCREDERRRVALEVRRLGAGSMIAGLTRSGRTRARRLNRGHRGGL